MDVSTEDLSADFGRFLKLARSGEVVVIVDDGNPVALLEPIDEGSNLRRGIREGWIRPPGRTGLVDGERYPSTMTTKEALDEDRG
jgi:antitoxin (DNA-binding transcriptional repressor) of toxin-antitoxin stability system